jgi:hypothetical protein
MRSVPDIFTLLDTKPHEGGDVYLVGSGPLGAEYVASIPEDAITIALNGAIQYNRIFTYWLANDCNIINQDYWQQLIVSKSTKVVFGTTLIHKYRFTEPALSGRIVPSYSFEFLPNLRTVYRNDILMPGILRNGASIAGNACQFGVFAGCKRLIWCGIDMRGNGHFDGFVNTRMHHSNIWMDCQYLTSLQYNLRLYHGVSIVSLSPTAVPGVRAVEQEELV